jgi:hypothetical protein
MRRISWLAEKVLASQEDQVSHPYKTTGKTTIVYNLIFVFLDSNLEDKDLAPNDSKHSH